MGIQKQYKREKGHLARRLIHLSISSIPFIYYWYGTELASLFFITREQLVTITVGCIILLELLRLKKGWLLYGQRQHEAKQPSAWVWGALSIGLVLLLAPQTGYQGAGLGTPLLLSLALGDPILGEARLRKLPNHWVLILGLATISLIWFFCAIWLNAPLWLIPIMAPLIVAAEGPKLKWIDDNATMLLIPLAVLMLIKHFLPYLL